MMVAPVPATPTDPSPSPEFQLTLSPGTTRHSRFLPQTSPRYHSLSSTPSAILEICPDASIYATDFAARIGGSSTAPKPQPSGAALILDYGTATQVPANSLRGIRGHELVSPFAHPGLVDLSADVDFTAIADIALGASEGVEVHGPVEQADFLETMGIKERAEQLVKGASGEMKERTEMAWKRLVDRGEGGMGRKYKALAIVPENGGRRRPVGFGGDIGGS
jgi:SAM-dependent MidA family methyltransferase